MGLLAGPRVVPIRRGGLPRHAPQASEAARESHRSLPPPDFRTLPDCARTPEFVKRSEAPPTCVLRRKPPAHLGPERADSPEINLSSARLGRSRAAKSFRHPVPRSTPTAAYCPLERLMFTACVYCGLMLPALSRTRTPTVCAPAPLTLTVTVEAAALLTGPLSTQ